MFGIRNDKITLPKEIIKNRIGCVASHLNINKTSTSFIDMY